MSVLLSDCVTRVKLLTKIQFSSLFSDAEYGSFVKMALDEINGDIPNTTVVEVSGDDSIYLALSSTNFPNWDNDFSTILFIEYPLKDFTSASSKPTFLEHSLWWVEQDTTDKYIVSPSQSFSSSEELRVKHTYKYEFVDNEGETDETVDLPDVLFSPLCYLAASLVLRTYLAYSIQDIEVTEFNVDSIDHNSVVGSVIKMIKEYKDNYKQASKKQKQNSVMISIYPGFSSDYIHS